MEWASNVRLYKLVTLCGSDHVLNLLALKRSSEIDWGNYIGDDLPFLRYDSEIRMVSDIVATNATKRPKVGGPILFDVLGHEVA